MRVTNGTPTTLATLRERVHVIRELANGRGVDYNGSEIRFPWAATSRAEVWVAAYGPKALQLTGEVADGFILQLADPDIAEWTIKAVRNAAADAGRDPAEHHDLRRRAGLRHRPTLEHRGRDQCRWFGGMVGNHVADIVARYGDDGRGAPGADRLHQGPRGLRLQRARPGRQHAHRRSCPTRSSTGSASSARSSTRSQRLNELKALGVDQFAVYLQHDAKDETLRAYGEHVMPAIADAGDVVPKR